MDVEKEIDQHFNANHFWHTKAFEVYCDSTHLM